MTLPRLILAGAIALLTAALTMSLLRPENAATSTQLRPGEYAVVTGIGDRRLNIRHAPRLDDSPALFRVREGERLLVLDGPRFGDSLDWWFLRDERFDVAGWAAGMYLKRHIPERES